MKRSIKRKVKATRINWKAKANNLAYELKEMEDSRNHWRRSCEEANQQLEDLRKDKQYQVGMARDEADRLFRQLQWAQQTLRMVVLDPEKLKILPAALLPERNLPKTYGGTDDPLNQDFTNYIH